MEYIFEKRINSFSPVMHLKKTKNPREPGQLGFVTLNGNLAVNQKPTHSPLLNGKGQFTFLKTKSSHSSSIVMYPPKVEFLRN